MKFPEQYRVRRYSGQGQKHGVFRIPRSVSRGRDLWVIATDGMGLTPWEHVSVSVLKNKNATPNWTEMCAVKDLFWDPEECVVQFHPPKSEYVNAHPGCLHLWRRSDLEWETPPKEFVG